MGAIEFEGGELIITSHIITYGRAAGQEITGYIREEIESMWNEPQASIELQGKSFIVRFRITAEYKPQITPIEIYQNLDPRNNYFRIEEFALGNISFVDGIRCNSGYFKMENLYKGSTTAAHEYGHTLGLTHPVNLDIRGKGVPGIMYPRGTLVDPQYQYEPDKPPGSKGGTMHPRHRRVLPEDIKNLHLHKLQIVNGTGIIGEFTNIWHPDHSQAEN